MTQTDSATMTLIHVDPRELEVNSANVRKKPAKIAELAASIRKVGVYVPLLVRETWEGGTFVIIDGACRALAAIAAGVATVPVIVRSDVDAGEAELAAMLVANLHREGLTPADEAAGYEQLAAFGISIADIAQLTGREAKRVTDGIVVAKSSAAIAIAVKHPLSFDHLAVIAEFDGDKKAVDKLVKTAEGDPRHFGHLVQDLRRDATRKAKGKAERERLKNAGVTVISKAFGYDLQSKTGVRLDYLKDPAGNEIKPGAHTKCAGHAASIGYDGNAVYGCVDPAKYGHKAQRGHSNSPSAAKPADPAMEAAAKLQADQDDDAIAASTIVRRQFVRELLARKTPPQGTLGLVVPLLIQFEMEPDDIDVVAEFTGTKKSSIDRRRPDLPFLALATGASDARLQMVLLCFVATSLESEWGRFLLAPAGWQSNIAEAKYLQFLDSCGYGLSDIEQRIIASAFPPAKKSKAAKRK